MLSGSLETLHTLLAGVSFSIHEKADCVTTEVLVSVWKLTWRMVGLRKHLSVQTPDRPDPQAEVKGQI